jgi:hypothetical protein
MNKELQGLFLCIAALGLAYTVLMLILMLFSGAKLVKTISVVFTLSVLLFTLGLSKDIRIRIKQRLLMFFSPQKSGYSAH